MPVRADADDAVPEADVEVGVRVPVAAAVVVLVNEASGFGYTVVFYLSTGTRSLDGSSPAPSWVQSRRHRLAQTSITEAAARKLE
jgi:hypothetical protein